MLSIKTEKHLWIVYVTTVFYSLTHTLENILVKVHFIYFKTHMNQ